MSLAYCVLAAPPYASFIQTLQKRLKTVPPSVISKARVDLSLPVPVLTQRFLNAAAAKLSLHRPQDFCGGGPINLVVNNWSAPLWADSHRS